MFILKCDEAEGVFLRLQMKEIWIFIHILYCCFELSSSRLILSYYTKDSCFKTYILWKKQLRYWFYCF